MHSTPTKECAQSVHCWRFLSFEAIASNILQPRFTTRHYEPIVPSILYCSHQEVVPPRFRRQVKANRAFGSHDLAAPPDEGPADTSPRQITSQPHTVAVGLFETDHNSISLIELRAAPSSG